MARRSPVLTATLLLGGIAIMVLKCLVLLRFSGRRRAGREA